MVVNFINDVHQQMRMRIEDVREKEGKSGQMKIIIRCDAWIDSVLSKREEEHMSTLIDWQIN